MGVQFQHHLALIQGIELQMNFNVWLGYKCSNTLWPLIDLEPPTGKYISEPRIFPFMGVVESVKIHVPNEQLMILVQSLV